MCSRDVVVRNEMSILLFTLPLSVAFAWLNRIGVSALFEVSCRLSLAISQRFLHDGEDGDSRRRLVCPSYLRWLILIPKHHYLVHHLRRNHYNHHLLAIRPLFAGTCPAGIHRQTQHHPFYSLIPGFSNNLKDFAPALVTQYVEFGYPFSASAAGTRFLWQK